MSGMGQGSYIPCHDVMKDGTSPAGIGRPKW